MTRIIMIAALVFLTISADAQSEYGGVGGPYAPMKFVVSDSSMIQTPVDSSENDRELSGSVQHEFRFSAQGTKISKYGESLSALTEK